MFRRAVFSRFDGRGHVVQYTCLALRQPLLSRKSPRSTAGIGPRFSRALKKKNNSQRRLIITGAGKLFKGLATETEEERGIAKTEKKKGGTTTCLEMLKADIS